MAAFEYGTVYNMFYLHKENVFYFLLVADDISDRKVALNAIMKARKANSIDRSIK